MSDMVGYMLTWTTYGTWLQGDERGWVKALAVDAAPSLTVGPLIGLMGGCFWCLFWGRDIVIVDSGPQPALG